MLNLVRVSDAATANRHSLAHRERHDTLTGLANRALFAERLTAIMAMPAESRPNAAVLLIDLDGFKLLNDTMGHAVGDEVLVAVARRLARNLGRHDVAARFGGDEFAVLIVPDAAADEPGRDRGGRPRQRRRPDRRRPGPPGDVLDPVGPGDREHRRGDGRRRDRGRATRPT